MIWAVLLTHSESPPVIVERLRDQVVVANGHVTLAIDERTGEYGVSWGKSASIDKIGGEVRLANGSLLRTSEYAIHEVAAGDVRSVRDRIGVGVRLTWRHRRDGRPNLLDEFWMYRDRPEVFVRLSVVSGSGERSNYLAPIITQAPVRLSPSKALCALFVPYDNDSYVRYRSDGWSRTARDGSYEVGALYDNVSRAGIVVGSIDHDTWKSCVGFGRECGVHAYSGAADKQTRDREPHGFVSGKVISSPRMVLGRYGDWRAGMERFADLNALVKPALKWDRGVPFGWNSWSGYKTKVNAVDARTATDFIHDDLPGFRSGGTAYVNFDSFWDNLSKAQLASFVVHAHRVGLKAGIYWSPFACWGGLDSKVEGSAGVKYGDIVIKGADGKPLPRLDGAYPIDPTHPAALARIDRELGWFVRVGFDYVKLDFLTHGALEGKHHDSKVMTGTQAYNLGMERIVENLDPKRIGRPFFISLSIAPLFPSGYAHSRRISCDVFANIGSSEYLLNSTNYGWWPGGRMYRFNDPDSCCVYQPLGEPAVTEAEARTRFLASVISGGMMLEGDDLLKTAAIARVERLFSNQELLDLARRTPNFRPINGETGSKAGQAFEWTDGAETYVAVFNFDRIKSQSLTIPAAMLGLSNGPCRIHDVWLGTDTDSSGDVSFRLRPMDCGLVRITSPAARK